MEIDIKDVSIQQGANRKKDYPRFLRGTNGEFQHFRVSKIARPGTPIGRPKVTGLSKNGALVNWEMRHRYRRGGKRTKIVFFSQGLIIFFLYP